MTGLLSGIVFHLVLEDGELDASVRPEKHDRGCGKTEGDGVAGLDEKRKAVLVVEGEELLPKSFVLGPALGWEVGLGEVLDVLLWGVGAGHSDR
jgi:hypothetical protein